jgi:hypothetical protein
VSPKTLIDCGFTIERRQVILDRPIKTLGLHQTRVALHPEVVVSVTLNVARSEDEAERQPRRGRDGGEERSGSAFNRRAVRGRPWRAARGGGDEAQPGAGPNAARDV